MSALSEGPSSFTPLQIPGCTIWLDGADPYGTNVTPLNGATVSSWVDKSGTGNTVSASSSQPTYVTNAQNGLGTLSFNGSQNLGTASILPTKFAGDTLNMTIFVVFALSSANNYGGSAYSCPFCWQTGSVPRIAMSWEGSAGLEMDVGIANPLRTSFTSPVLTLDNTYYMASYSKAGANTQFNLNGSTYASSSSQTTTSFATGYTASFNVGNGFDRSAYYMRGNVAEIIFYGSVLSTTKFQQIEGYLAWKWGLQSQLPIGHPYLSLSPNTLPFRLSLLPSIPFMAAAVTSFSSSSPFPPSLIPSLPFSINNASLNPLKIAACQIWLDAADTNTLATSGTSVSQWNDKSGNGYNLTQGTSGSQPQQAGKYITFSSNRFFNIPQSSMNNASTWSLTFVFNPTAATNWIITKQYDGVNTYNVVSMTNNTTNGGMIQSGTSGYLYLRTYNGGSQASSGSSLTLSTLQIINISYNGTNLYMYINGTLISTTSGSFAIQDQRGATNFTMGAWIQNGSSYNDSGITNFQMGEFMFHSTLLSTQQRQLFEGYLAWKWGLQTSLPAKHPFINLPPSPF